MNNPISDDVLREILRGCALATPGPYRQFGSPQSEAIISHATHQMVANVFGAADRDLALLIDPATVSSIILELLALREAVTWQDISTAKLGEIIDVYVWNVGDSGPEDGFRWADVKLISALPQTIVVPGAEGEWSEYEMSQNGQFISHWSRPLPTPPTKDTNHD